MLEVRQHAGDRGEGGGGDGEGDVMSAWSTAEHINMEQRPSRGEDEPRDQGSEEGSSSDSDPEDQGGAHLQVSLRTLSASNVTGHPMPFSLPEVAARLWNSPPMAGRDPSFCWWRQGLRR